MREGASEIERVRMRGCETARKRENSNEKDFRDEEEGERSRRKREARWVGVVVDGVNEGEDVRKGAKSCEREKKN